MSLLSKITSGPRSRTAADAFLLCTIPALVILAIQLYHTLRYYPAVPDFMRTLLWNLWLVSPLYIALTLAEDLHLRERISKAYLTFLFILHLLFALATIGHMLLFRCHITFLSIVAVLQTDANEMRNFAEAYTSRSLLVPLIGFAILYAGCFIRAMLRIEEAPAKTPRKWCAAAKTAIAGILIVLVPFLVIDGNKKGLEKNTLLRSSFITRTLVETSAALKSEQKKAEMLAEANHPVDFGNVSLLDDAEKRTYVIILGEGASRHHMSLYGYPRQTSAPLDAMKDELIVYRKAISVYGTTAPSLNAAFIFHDIQARQKGGIASLVNLHKAAGFKTYWLTNNLAEQMGKGAAWFNISSDVLVNRNKATSFTQLSSYDSELLPDLKAALEDSSAANKFIVLHLAGMHPTYSFRYPGEAAVYANDSREQLYNRDVLDSDKVEKINQYDNAMTFNNANIKAILDMVAGTSGSSYVVALSDHSQQLFEIADSFGGHVATNGTQYMYDIPFFVWLSPEYKARHPEFSAALKQGTDRFWKMDDSLGHSIAELGHISFGGFQPEKSLFSSAYKTPDGRLGDGTDYFTLPGIAKR